LKTIFIVSRSGLYLKTSIRDGWLSIILSRSDMTGCGASCRRSRLQRLDMLDNSEVWECSEVRSIVAICAERMSCCMTGICE
jgi:hypothetical protein